MGFHPFGPEKMGFFLNQKEKRKKKKDDIETNENDVGHTIILDKEGRRVINFFDNINGLVPSIGHPLLLIKRQVLVIACLLLSLLIRCGIIKGMRRNSNMNCMDLEIA